MSITKNDFQTFVVCPLCHSIYDYNQCFEIKFGHKESKLCNHVSYPNHPQRAHRKSCGATLLKKVRKKGGYDLEPFMIYCYKSLRYSIERLVQRKGFIDSCEKWRNRQVPDDYSCDIFDGDIWRSFSSQEKEYFLSNPHCYLSILNVDWFQPFEQGVYSVGAIYLTIQNLPRDERNRPENIMLIGILPGPREPKKTINSFLTPLVLELKEAWTNGFTVLIQNVHICIKLALSCVTCDIPAAKKVCGFLSHHSKHGCNKCLKQFNVNFTEGTDFSGFNREDWIPRTLQQHCSDIEAIQREVTKGGQKSKESESGIRYSVLMDLPYFDPCTFLAIVDTMHNLFLGTGKHVFTTWVETGTVTHHNLSVIEQRVKQFNIPADVGRLPSNMKSCYNGFTANQWKNWITIYSLVILKDLLPNEHFHCWQLFVRSCIILCSYCPRRCDFTTADILLLQFCRQFEALYGSTRCTFNMHLHLHLKKIYLDFGPPHATWCYAFERFNGMLGSYFTNKKAIEPQIMRRFCQHQQIVLSTEKYNEADFPTFQFYGKESKAKSVGNSLYLLHYATRSLSEITSFSVTNCDLDSISPLSPAYEEIMSLHELCALELIYKQLYPSQTIQNLSATFFKFGRLLFTGDLIGSDMPGPNSHTSSVIMAYWPSRGSSLNHIDYSRKQVGIVQYFLRHDIWLISDNNHVKQEHIFAYVKWKELHEHYDWYGVSATVCNNSFEVSGACCFLPIQRIFCRCAYTLMPIKFSDLVETVFIACPISFKYCL